jgi:Ca2+:H+ antiporter
VSRAYVLAVFIPIAIVLDLANAPAAAIFFSAALGIVPTAILMSDATEHLADRAGPGIGSLLNVTFGNAPELIIAFVALADGLQEVVKASLVGSVMGNSLLVLGFAMLAGGIKHGRQTFSRRAIEHVSRLFLVTTIVLVLPAVVEWIASGDLPGPNTEHHDYATWVELLSLAVALGLVSHYSYGLTKAMRNRTGIFEAAPDAEPPAETWTVRRSVALLAIAGALVGVMSEVLVGSIEEASHAVGLSTFFIGVFVVGIAGNAAEHWVAVVFAIRNKMDLSLNIGIGSSIQIAMFLVPVLVVASFVLGPHPMSLVFNPYEIVGIALTGLVVFYVVRSGDTTRFEGALLLGLYAVLAVVFALA